MSDFKDYTNKSGKTFGWIGWSIGVVICVYKGIQSDTLSRDGPLGFLLQGLIVVAVFPWIFWALGWLVGVVLAAVFSPVWYANEKAKQRQFQESLDRARSAEKTKLLEARERILSDGLAGADRTSQDVFQWLREHEGQEVEVYYSQGQDWFDQHRWVIPPFEVFLDGNRVRALFRVRRGVNDKTVWEFPPKDYHQAEIARDQLIYTYEAYEEFFDWDCDHRTGRVWRISRWMFNVDPDGRPAERISERPAERISRRSVEKVKEEDHCTVEEVQRTIETYQKMSPEQQKAALARLPIMHRGSEKELHQEFLDKFTNSSRERKTESTSDCGGSGQEEKQQTANADAKVTFIYGPDGQVVKQVKKP